MTPRTSHHRAWPTRRCWLRKYNSKFNYLLSLSRAPARHEQGKLSKRSQVKLGYLCNKLISHEKICIGCILSQNSPANVSLGTVGRMTRMTSHRWFRLADFNHLSSSILVAFIIVARVILQKSALSPSTRDFFSFFTRLHRTLAKTAIVSSNTRNRCRFNLLVNYLYMLAY